ncbi:MAG: hypothetical protein ABI778_08465 [Ignavibacteriota bacterium]
MKKNILVKIQSRTGLVLLCGVLLTPLGCSKNTDRSEGILKDTVISTQTSGTTALYQVDYPVYKTETEKIIIANRDTISAFKREMSKANRKMRAALDSSSKALERTNDMLGTKLENFKADGKEAWSDFKAQFDRSMDSVKKALKDLKVKLRGNDDD